jgi:hypothetical protein
MNLRYAMLEQGEYGAVILPRISRKRQIER